MKSKNSKKRKYKEHMKKYPKDKQYILENVKYDTNVLKYADKDLLKNKEFVLQVVKENGMALKYVSAKLKNDKDVVIIALQNSSGFALKYASEELRANKEVVNESIKRWKAPLKYASPELREEALKRIEDYYKKHKI